MSYTLTEIENYTVTVGYKQFIIHTPFFNLLPNISLFKNNDNILDLNILLFTPLDALLSTRYDQCDQSSICQYTHKDVMNLLGDTFEGIYKLLYSINYALWYYDNGKLHSINDSSYPFSLSTLFDVSFWMINILGLSERLCYTDCIKDSIHDMFVNNIHLSEKNYVTKEEYENEVEVQNNIKNIFIHILDYYNLEHAENYTIPDYAFELIKHNDIMLELISELQINNYFFVAEYMKFYSNYMEFYPNYTPESFSKYTLFPELFFNVKINNIKLYSLNSPDDYVIIHSPCLKHYSKYDDNILSLQVPFSKHIITEGIKFLYKVLSICSYDNKNLKHLISKTEEFGYIYFFLKEIKIYHLNNSTIPWIFIYRNYYFNKYLLEKRYTNTTLTKENITIDSINTITCGFLENLNDVSTMTLIIQTLKDAGLMYLASGFDSFLIEKD